MTQEKSSLRDHRKKFPAPVLSDDMVVLVMDGHDITAGKPITLRELRLFLRETTNG